jgi:hypothetical protein
VKSSGISNVEPSRCAARELAFSVESKNGCSVKGMLLYRSVWAAASRRPARCLKRQCEAGWMSVKLHRVAATAGGGVCASNG